MAGQDGHSPGQGALQAIRFVVIMSALMAGALGAQSQVGITLLRQGLSPARHGGDLDLEVLEEVSPGMQDVGGAVTPKESPQKPPGLGRVG